MEIKINPAWPLTDIGGKPNQEDRIYPYEERRDSNGTPTDFRCFVLCDGMGGHENGEVAAEIVSHTLQPALTASATTPDVMSVERFDKALKATYAELDKMEVTQGKRPGTTMTCVYLAENGVFVAHIGDSRIYQVRPGDGILFRSMDHSLVNELVKAGEITEEEAAHHPRRNIITRAMQPGLEVPFRADTRVITDVKAGDYFFMCSDGVLENLTDEKLVEILSKDITDKEKREEIYNICVGRTRDNFSAVIIPIASVNGEPLPTPEPTPVKTEPIQGLPVTPVAPVSQPNAAPEKRPVAPGKTCPKSKALMWILALVALVALVAGAYFLGTKNSDDDKTDTATERVQSDNKPFAKDNNASKSDGRSDDDDDDKDDDDDRNGKDNDRDDAGDAKEKADEALENITDGVKNMVKDKADNKITDNNGKIESSALNIANKVTSDAKAGQKTATNPASQPGKKTTKN